MANPKFAGKADVKSEVPRGLSDTLPSIVQVVTSSVHQYAEEAVSESGAEIGVSSSLRRVPVPISVMKDLKEPLIKGMIDGFLVNPLSYEAAMGGKGNEGVVLDSLRLMFDWGLVARVKWVTEAQMNFYYKAGPGYFENDVFQTMFSLLGEVSFAGVTLYPTLSTELSDWSDEVLTHVNDVVMATDVMNRLFAARLLKKAPQWMLRPRAGTVTGMVVAILREKDAIVGYTDVIDRAEALMAAVVWKDLFGELGKPGFSYGSADSFKSALYRMGLKASGK